MLIVKRHIGRQLQLDVTTCHILTLGYSHVGHIGRLSMGRCRPVISLCKALAHENNWLRRAVQECPR